MYDRAERNLSLLIGSTPRSIGPGTYDTPASNIKCRPEGYAPFLSLAERDLFFGYGNQVIVTPGPGHYNPILMKEHVKGGNNSKSKRFMYKCNENPGPGTYNTPSGQNPPGSAPQLGGPGKLIVSRITFHREPVAPSIPMNGQAYGYEECEDGTLKKQNPPDRDITLGPAFYKPFFDDTQTTKTYRGVHFGSLTGKRGLFKPADGPGPGTYDPTIKAIMNVEHAHIDKEDQARFESHVPRYLDYVVKNEEKQSMPGPGKYDIKGQFDRMPEVNAEGLEVEHPPFLCQSKRFVYNSSAVPAPGTYNDPRCALQATKRLTGIKHSPFGQTSIRFQTENQSTHPGPDAYSIAGMGSESIKKAYIESTQRGVFGSSAIRNITFSNKDAPDLPGPSHYRVKEKPFKSSYKLTSSMFSSVSNRFFKSETPQTNPAPDYYNVATSYYRTQNPEKQKPRTKDAHHRHSSFLSAVSRFSKPHDVIIKRPDPLNPGPGAYDPKLLASSKLGPSVTKAKRFNGIKQLENPGPGTYEIAPVVQDTVVKGSFNVTFAKPAETVHMPDTSVDDNASWELNY